MNRQKNAKKKQPVPLTEEMLNELNKNHMGGLDNYGADDLYNMEDVWNDKTYDMKPPKKVIFSHHLYQEVVNQWSCFIYRDHQVQFTTTVCPTCTIVGDRNGTGTTTTRTTVTTLEEAVTEASNGADLTTTQIFEIKTYLI